MLSIICIEFGYFQRYKDGKLSLSCYKPYKLEPTVAKSLALSWFE